MAVIDDALVLAGPALEEAGSTNHPASSSVRHRTLRRLPTPAERARRRPIVLTARNLEILAALGLHGFLTAALVERAFFPPRPADRAFPCSDAYERLRQLWLWGYVERLELPVSRLLPGRLPVLYALSARGWAVLGLQQHDAGGAPGGAPLPRRLDRLEELFLEHDLRVAHLWANMQALVRAGRLSGCRWTAERELRARHLRVVDPRTGQELPVLPDGYVELDYPDGTVQSCMVEVDMGTLTLGRFRTKLQALERFLMSGAYRSQWGRKSFEVLIVTPSRRRLTRLWQVGRQVIPPAGWRWYSLATFAVLEAPRFDRPDAWLTLQGTHCGLLYAQPAGEEKRRAIDDLR